MEQTAGGFEKIVVITRKTRLQGLIARFNTQAQARFYVNRAGGDVSDIEQEDAVYRDALDLLLRQIDPAMKLQVMDREITPTYLFSEADLVVTLGQDGLVANTAKYALGRPIIAVNPDPARFDGILLPFQVAHAGAAIRAAMSGKARMRHVTLAEARLGDGQRLLAFNDLFLGARTHVSARYQISFGGQNEHHSSSGVIVSTGAGSSGWLSSMMRMAGGIGEFLGGDGNSGLRFDWEDRRLCFVVREPFTSRHSQSKIVAGFVEEGQALSLESRMPADGVIFSDGVESDRLEFNSGAIARIGVAPEVARLVVPA